MGEIKIEDVNEAGSSVNSTRAASLIARTRRRA
jgi:hypothetical protein